MVRLRRLMLKHNMLVLVENLEAEATAKGIDLDQEESMGDDDEDAEAGGTALQQNTPDWDDDFDLTTLTDSDASDLDESEKLRPKNHIIYNFHLLLSSLSQ